MISEEKYYNEYVTCNTFVNPDFRFHSQFSDCDMIEKGLDVDDTLENLQNYFNNIINTIGTVNSNNNSQNIKTLSLRK